MRALALVGVVACGATPAPVPAVPVVAPSVDAAAVTTPIAMVPAAAKRRSIEAPHGGEIRLVALTPDGKVALSVDDLGGARLWPALDGTQEPRVVDLPDGKQVAITRRGDGFMVSTIDDAGNLVFTDIDGAGLTRAHATIDGDPAFVGVEMTELGALAWRSDQTLGLYGNDGTQLSRLGTDAGQQLVQIATRGRFAMAIVETLVGDKLEKRARELVLEPKLAWGRTLDAGKLSDGSMAISPAGKRLALVVKAAPDQPLHTVVIDLKTGKQLADANAAGQAVLGFIDDDHLAIAAPGVVSWLDLSEPKPTSYPIGPGFAGPVVLAVGGGRAVTRNSGELVLQTPLDNQFLGYGLAAPSVAAPGPDGRLVIGLGDVFTSLGADLHADPNTLPAVPKGVNVYQLRWLGNADWAAEVSQVTDGATSVVMISSDGTPAAVVRAGMRVIQPMLYEPSTHLLTLSLGESPEIDRYDPAKRRVDRVVALPKPKGFEQFELVPVAPKLASGTTILKIAIRERTTVEWMSDDKASVRTQAAMIDSYAGADAAGRVFAWNNSASGELGLEIFAAGARAGTLPHDGPVSLWPDPAATRVLETAQHAVSLYQVDGKLLWSQNLAGINEALWLADGAIAIVTAAGIARLDPKTGNVLAARCGWRFGLAPKPHPAASRIEPVCTQLDRSND